MNLTYNFSLNQPTSSVIVAALKTSLHTNQTKAMAAALTGQPYPDLHAVPQYQPTLTQLTLIVAYGIVVTVWVFRLLISFSTFDVFDLCRHGNTGIHAKPHSEHVLVGICEENHVVNNKHDANSNSDKHVAGDRLKTIDTNSDSKDDPVLIKENFSGHQAEGSHKPPVPAIPDVSLDRFLASVVLFGAIMIYFYLSDYRKASTGERTYSRDTFLFLVFLFFLVACCFTIKPNADKILNSQLCSKKLRAHCTQISSIHSYFQWAYFCPREQTEEWKGWMQVMFVWYHYFKAKEWYNWIRVYIACYVWMTGFGNFSFFWIRNDYSAWRLLKMLFRLNFLVIFVAMVTNNEYMLYYICAMHTYWFLTVYVFMRVLKSWNKNRKLMAVKFAAYAFFNAIIFEIPGWSLRIFRPFQLILGLHDNSGDIMHEWSFRAGLDHWACYFGMLCAYNYPHFERLMLFLDSKSLNKNEAIKKLCVRIFLGLGCLILGSLWYFLFMQKDKFEYNATHPYTALISILVYIIARNIHPVLRSHHINMFAWLGKITLETYLSQLHIYLLSNARSLVVFLDGYPLLNFSLATIMYLAVSHSLFTITNDCSSFLIPRDHKKVVLNIAGLCFIFIASACFAFLVIV
ncbi:unnamed protein product [Lymnaea stagnalis]|uniref:Cas1p 10 TM acyl transferase domain-containing protein n=1 Tax=Lymnaea stagnalis TaxID=6523 RepID=A0AAV2I344_LYMST